MERIGGETTSLHRVTGAARQTALGQHLLLSVHNPWLTDIRQMGKRVQSADAASPTVLAIRVAVCTEQKALAERLTAMLDAEPDIEVVGPYAGLAELIEFVRDERPVAALVDYAIPDGDGVAAMRELSLTAEHRQLVTSDLSPRELDVLKLLVAGTSNREVADRLSLSFNTVRNHVHNILKKLSAHSRLEAAAIAVREGIVKRG